MAKISAKHVATRYLQRLVGGEGQSLDLKLQLTKQRQFLSIDRGEVSDMAGIDVIRPWRRADPSVPLNVQIDSSLRPITQAFPSVFDGHGTQVFVGVTRDTVALGQSALIAADASGDIPSYV